MTTGDDPGTSSSPDAPTPPLEIDVQTLRLWPRWLTVTPKPKRDPNPTVDPTPPEADNAPTDHWRRDGPFLLVALAVAFNLWAFRAQGEVVGYANDTVVHLQMVTVAHHLISLGRLPFGQWYPFMAQGSPFFVQYQSLSAILTGLLAEVTGPHLAISLTLYLLFSLWPICVYWASRLLGWSRWIAGVAATMAPLIYGITERGFEARSYTWSGSGLWSQLWVMWALPLAWAFCWRYVSQRKYFAGAVLTLALTIAFHFITAYLAILALAVFVLARPSDLVHRLRRAAAVGAGAVLATLWVTVPLIADSKWTAFNSALVGTTAADSYGAPTVLKWLVSGSIYDYTRLPVITILVGIGLIVCLRRWRVDERARVIVGLWVLSLLLFFGRPTLGAVLDLLPGNQNLLFQRYVSGVQLAGIIMAGVGAVSCARVIADLVKRALSRDRERGRRLALYERFRIPLAGLGLIVVLTPAWNQLQGYGSAQAFAISWQRGHDQTQGQQLNVILDYLAAHGGGRVYAGLASNWGRTFEVGDVQVYLAIDQAGDIDNVGYGQWTSSLMRSPEQDFDETNPGDYQAFDVRYLLLPAGHPPPVPAHLILSSGVFTLWTVAGPGLIQVVDTQGTIDANKTNVGTQTSQFLQSSGPGDAIYPTIAYDGAPAATPTLGSGTTPAGAAGTVVSSRSDLTVGYATARVVANRTAVVLLKTSYDPGWTVTVDGRPATTEMVAPALVGVTVPPGDHTVTFVYRGYRHYPLLFLISAITVIGVVVGWVRWRRLALRLTRRVARLRATPVAP